MRVLVVGSGGREAAIAWTCRRSGHDVDVAADLPDPCTADLVIVGPEAALVAGVADECARRGIPCFGPTAAVARLESSKGFTRDLAAQLGIASPAYHRSESVGDALDWWRSFGRPVVVKLDGLAAGKGVIVPTDGPATEAAIRELGAAGPIVLEEQLQGSECSLMALCDGRVAVPLPIAQDHKRIGEADTGPNTGGMGAYAPAPVPYTAAELTAAFVQPVVDHLAAAGTPYVGVLYAGLMLTPTGPRLLEFNCRFGDPEAQAVLPLLACDLAEVLLACTAGRLDESSVTIRTAPVSSLTIHDGAVSSLTIHDGADGWPLAACTVVAAAPGYPNSPVLGGIIDGIHPESRPEAEAGGDVGDEAAIVFPAGVRDGRVAGGRVLAVTGLGTDLAAARDAAYARMATIRFEGMQVRRDIGWRASGATLTSYAATGVDIDEGTRAVEQMQAAVERTHGPAVLRGVGSFGGVFSAAALTAMAEPLLVASTDGVGTKVELAARLGRYRGVGHDIVNHCIDDVLVQGARPLFFLDYIAASRIDATQVAEVVTGMAEACAAAGCALLGGETAEMPGVYAPGAFDIAGTLVGAVDRADLLPRPDVGVGDVLIGVGSSGPHTNGYSLLRALFRWLPLDATPAGFPCTVGDALLAPHRNYLPVLDTALATGTVKALAHITGGGLPENLPRVLPTGCGAVVHLGSWPLPPLFALVREVASGMSTHELYRTVNMGIGMVVVCAAENVDDVRAAIAEPTWVIGELVPGDRRVELRECVA